MLISKEQFSNRFSQTFKILKDNFAKLFLPFFIYNFISIVIIGTISKYYFYTSFLAIKGENTINYFSLLNNPIIIMLIMIGTLLYVGYLILYIPIFIALIKTINQIYNEEEININENLKYGFFNILNSFKTYWYIFAYVILLPAIGFIIGGFLVNLGLYFDKLKFLENIGGVFISVSFFIFIYYSIYRGTKAKFALYSAISNNNFTKDDFNNSVNITENKWWRIFGNIFFNGLILSIIIGIISGIISGIFLIGDNGFFNMNILNLDIKNPIQVIDILKKYINNFSFTSEIINKIINTIFQTFSSIFTIIFIFLLFKRLKFENKILILEINNKPIEKKILLHKK